MTMPYKLSKLAEDDLLAIARYSLKHWGKQRAKLYIQALDSRFEQLGQNPQLGQRRDAIKLGYFSFNEGSHVIFYKHSADDAIMIIRILHQRMDFIRHL